MTPAVLGYPPADDRAEYRSAETGEGDCRADEHAGVLGKPRVDYRAADGRRKERKRNADNDGRDIEHAE